jgi:hypothetical protein
MRWEIFFYSTTMSSFFQEEARGGGQRLTPLIEGAHRAKGGEGGFFTYRCGVFFYERRRKRIWTDGGRSFERRRGSANTLISEQRRRTISRDEGEDSS